MAQELTTRSGVRRTCGAALGLALMGAGSVALADAAVADPNPNVTICHATSSTKNPYQVITIDAAAITKQGHGKHARDVIPPFEYVAANTGRTVSFEGLNWDDNWETNGEGEALEEVDASLCGGGAEPSPTPTPTTTPTPSSTPTPTTTTTPTPTSSSTPTPTTTTTPTPTSSSTPTPTATATTPTSSTTPTPTSSTTPTATPTTPAIPSTAPTPKPSRPVVETDGVAPSGPNPGLLAGGAALLLGGAATIVASRRGTRS